MASSLSTPAKVFISYSHLDKAWLERLKRHLKPLVREGYLDCWDDTHIRPGDDWQQEIRTALDRAQVAVLLISADFFASDFIDETELPPLLDAAEAKGVRILPVILSASRFARDPNLARFQAVNPPDRPLNQMTLGEQEKIFEQLAHTIEKALGARKPLVASSRTQGTPPGRPSDVSTQQTDSNRPRMLAKVRRDWIPLWKWILALPWAGRLAILMVCAATLTLGWEETQRVFSTGSRIVAVTLHSGHYGIPMSSDYVRRVKEAIARLDTSLEADISSSDDPFPRELGPWLSAQVIIALKDITQLRPEKFSASLHSQQDLTCSCWREFPQTQEPRHILVSAWVLFALAHLNSVTSPYEVRFMLDVQSGEGWWPIFLYDKPERQENASTYASAFSLLALNELLDRHLLPPEQNDPVNDAIRRGTSWLVNHGAPGQARWWDYPLSGNKKMFQALSGLVIYTLHRVDRTSLLELDREWLAELPESLPSADACEISLVWTKTLDGPYQDHNCQLPLAWMLAATVDAYPNGDTIQKARAMAWVERVLDETNILQSETLSDDYKRAEILISLKHLIGDHGSM